MPLVDYTGRSNTLTSILSRAHSFALAGANASFSPSGREMGEAEELCLGYGRPSVKRLTSTNRATGVPLAHGSCAIISAASAEVRTGVISNSMRSFHLSVH